MDLGSLLLILGIFILVILFISLPFVKRRTVPVRGENSDMSSWLAEQDRIIDALLELDFDHEMGKIPDEIYQQQRRHLLTKGVSIMQQIESRSGNMLIGKKKPGEYAGNTIQTNHSQNSSSGKQGGKRPLATPDDDIEVLLATRRRERGEKAGGFCPQCGSPLQMSDRFCPHCGEALSPEGFQKK